MSYNARNANIFWGQRVDNTDKLEAVLNYGVPRYVNEAYSKWELACLLDALPDVFDREVMDLACGNGRVTIPIARLSAKVTAVDNSEGMLRACSKNVKHAGLADRVTFKQANAAKLPFNDHHFDVSLCLGLLEHLPQKERQTTLSELIRVTKTGGTILITANNKQSFFLQRGSTSQAKEQYQDGKLKGFFSGLVGKDWVEAFFHNNGVTTEVMGSNTFQAFAIHMLRQTNSFDDNDLQWQSLFKTCAELDICYRNKGDLDSTFSDQYLIRAIKQKELQS